MASVDDVLKKRRLVLAEIYKSLAVYDGEEPDRYLSYAKTKMRIGKYGGKFFIDITDTSYLEWADKNMIGSRPIPLCVELQRRAMKIYETMCSTRFTD